MKQDNSKQVEQTSGNGKSRTKSVLDSFHLFYESLEFKPNRSNRLISRLQRPSKARS